MNLHDQIMNLRVAPTELATSLYAGDTTLAYKIGHRDARHAAAELALAADAEIERLQTELDRRFGIGGELIVARRDRDEALHKQSIAEQALERLVRRCEAEMADTIDVSEIQTAKALLGLGA